MRVYFVGAGPGDPELLTRKAERLLQNAKICVYAGSLVSPGVLALLPANTEKYDSAAMNLEEIVAVYREAQSRDIDVIRLHSGDPSIYGAIREQINELDCLGIDYEVIPGISSFQASAAALKTELTAPEVSQTIILTRTSGRTPLPEEQELHQLAKSKATLCIFLSAHKIKEVAETLSEYYGQGCPAAVVYHASWPDEKVIQGTLADIAIKIESSSITKTAMIIVGQALFSPPRDIPVSRLYHADFTHEYRSKGNNQ